MREYYLFIVKSEFYKAYASNPFSLFKTLENLYGFTFKDAKFGISLYHQLCEPHNVDLLKDYFKAKGYRRKKNRYLLTEPAEAEKTIIDVRPSTLLIRTNRNIPAIFRILHYYNHYIFVCDFKNKDYFWLSSQYKK